MAASQPGPDGHRRRPTRSGRTMPVPALLGIALLGTLALGAVPCAQPECVRLGHPGRTDGYWSTLVREIARELQRGTGKTKRVMPLSLTDLGGVDKALIALRHRHLDLAVVPNVLLAREIPAFDVLNLPLEIRDLGHAGRVSGSRVERMLQAEAARKGYRLLGFAWRGGTFVSVRQCIRAPADVRGAKLVDGPDLYARLLGQAGAAVVQLPFAELRSALESGVADGALLTIELLGSLQIGGARRCLTRPRSAPFMILPEAIVAVADADAKDRFDPRLTSALRALARTTLTNVATAGEALEQQSAARNVELASIGEKERGAWREVAAPLREDFVKRVEAGKALLEALRELN